MIENTARFISRILHPLTVPVYALVAILCCWPLRILIPAAAKVALWAVTLSSMIVLPVLMIFFMKRRGWISGLDMNKREERIFPVLVSCIFIFAGYLILGKFPLTDIFRALYMITIVALSFFAGISVYWKISMHAMAWGIMCGFLLPFGIVMRPLFIVALVCSGFVGSSRLVLGCHSVWQVLSGFAFGFFITLTLILI